MGEVYRATDTHLKRTVAIKVLPEAVATDGERLARFQREAEVLARLNHPNIASIYGLEKSDGTAALVLELVEGPTLADRIAQGPIPNEDALPIAKQIAEAVEAAHEQGIVHRDLKPANVKVRPDGVVKVLDFGLAKALDPVAAGNTDATASPTITSPAMTRLGVILGTAAYMSPEQAKSQAVDKRSDVWAFGCVLYEMLTGKRAFGGEHLKDVLRTVVQADPDWSALPTTIPRAILVLLQSCLVKDRRHRVADLSTVVFVLGNAASLAAPSPPEPISSATGTGVSRRSMWRRVAVAGATMLALGAGLAATFTWLLMRLPTPRVTRTTIGVTGLEAPAISGIDRDLAVTPDGGRIVYVGNNGTQVFIRPLDQLAPTALIRSPFGIFGVFTSPDGHWVGYVEGFSELKKVPITGGPPVRVLEMHGLSAGATWLSDDTIIFATSNTPTGLQRVSSAGGATTVLTRPNRNRGEAAHIWPERLPGGRAVLFTILPETGGLDAAQVAVLDLATGAQHVLVQGGSHAQYVASGHLVYAAGGTLRAVAFDLAGLAVRGRSVPVLSRIATTQLGGADVVISASGTLLYMDAPGGAPLAAHTLVWVDRQGREQPLAAPPRPYGHPRVSPDGTRVALPSFEQEMDLWIWNPARETLTRLTSDPANEASPVWTLDGKRLVFTSDRAGVLNLYWQVADSTGTAERLTVSPNVQVPTGITPDGTQIVFFENTGSTGSDLMLLTLTHPRRVMTLLATRFNERNGTISPNGRWLAYESDESGPDEIYVRPFPLVGGDRWQVSTTGGRQPLWAPNGRELFYAAPDGSALLAVTIDPHGDAWKAGTPRKVLDGRYLTAAATVNRNYDMSVDGRFLLLKQGGGDPASKPPQIIVVQHWDEELKRLVPTR